ncbi:hypothetical protein PVAP13_3NG078805 [Panicum virgatum]|uniref:Uncharacterized protein n=1 Tax=Panicum virgatum TaxID=38727 RepID=A0A8T0U7Z5_PANVG|nr:hypothetical protein PVAP13_3NG078805 [Panicum virgatum]
MVEVLSNPGGYVGEQHGSAGLEGRPLHVCFHEFRIHYEGTKHLAVGQSIH